MAVSARGIRRGRQLAEKLMRARVLISRPTGETEFDEATFKQVSQVETVYEGVGKVQSYEAYEANPVTAGARATSIRVRVDIPVGVARVQPGDRVEVLENLDDPLLVGRVYRVGVVGPYKSTATAYRIFVDEVTHG
ncbi:MULTISPECIES: DUF6093 family protein [Trueperella]|nr:MULTISPECIES: DUF6093 family protein [Trueperella]MDY5404396.1 DUF6093 family protein [Trueperella sp.]